MPYSLTEDIVLTLAALYAYYEIALLNYINCYVSFQGAITFSCASGSHLWCAL